MGRSDETLKVSCAQPGTNQCHQPWHTSIRASGRQEGCGWSCPAPPALHLREEEQMLCSHGKCSAGQSAAQGHRRASQTCKHHWESHHPLCGTQKTAGRKFQMLLLWEGNEDYDLPGICEKELPLSVSFLMNYSNTVLFIYLFPLTQRFISQANRKRPKQTSYSHK